ncbi:hypothetical protein HZS_532, partial [Henneguya salminicola]
MDPRKSEAGLLSQIAALRNEIAAIDREIAYRKIPGPFTEARRRNFYKFRYLALGIAKDDLQTLRVRLSLELKASGHTLSLRQKEAKTRSANADYALNPKRFEKKLLGKEENSKIPFKVFYEYSEILSNPPVHPDVNLSLTSPVLAPDITPALADP